MKQNDKIYIGIDFSLKKFNACMLVVAHGLIVHGEFENTKAGYRKLLAWAKRESCLGRGYRAEDVLFCGEHTGVCSLGLSDYLYSKGLNMWLECASRIKYSSGLSRAKDDKVDAEMIALYAQRFYDKGKTRLYETPSEDMRRLTALYEFRCRKVSNRVGCINRIKSGRFDNSKTVASMMQKDLARDTEDVKVLEQEMQSLLSTSPEFMANYCILLSFKGIGLITAAALIIYTGNFKNFDDPRRFSCFAGMAPFGKQSGTSINTKPHVSRFAHIGAKNALTQAATCAMRFNPVIKAYAQHLVGKRKEHGVIMNNVKNKILHIVFAMISTGTKWDPDYQNKHMSSKPEPNADDQRCDLRDTCRPSHAEAPVLSAAELACTRDMPGDVAEALCQMQPAPTRPGDVNEWLDWFCNLPDEQKHKYWTNQEQLPDSSATNKQPAPPYALNTGQRPHKK